jgi:hypothetical protein
VTEYSNVGHPAPSGQRHYVGTQIALCILAIAVFVGFVWSRSLDWAHISIMITGSLPKDMQDIEQTVGRPGYDWGPASSPGIWVYGMALVGMNGLYLFFHRFIDQLFPAITNTVIGGWFTVLLAYLIVNVDGAMCCEHPNDHPIAYENTYAKGAYPALACALGLLAIGVAQVLVRRRAKVEDALELP